MLQPNEIGWQVGTVACLVRPQARPSDVELFLLNSADSNDGQTLIGIQGVREKRPSNSPGDFELVWCRLLRCSYVSSMADSP